MPARSPAALPASGSSFQIVILSGVVHGEPVTGVTRAGEALCSLDLMVNDEAGRCLVPLTWRNAPPPELAHGAAVVVRGRVVKRFHRAGATTVARTSVEVDEVLTSPKRAHVRRLVARAVEPHGGAGARPARPGARA